MNNFVVTIPLKITVPAENAESALDAAVKHLEECPSQDLLDMLEWDDGFAEEEKPPIARRPAGS